MRVWDAISPQLLCRQHLLGEHVEVHGIWSIWVNGKQGYRGHPEVERWNGHLPALAARHNMLVAEMERRGMNHNSPLKLDGVSLDLGGGPPESLLDEQEQLDRLAAKDCPCPVRQACNDLEVA